MIGSAATSAQVVVVVPVAASVLSSSDQ